MYPDEGMRRASAEEVERLALLYGPALLRMCYVYLKDRALAEDAAQETLIKAYLHYGSFRGESSEKTWPAPVYPHLEPTDFGDLAKIGNDRIPREG